MSIKALVIIVTLGFILLSTRISFAEEPKSVEALIQATEQTYYENQDDNRLTRVDELLDKIAEADPNSVYPFWAKSRQTFARHESLLLRKNQQSQKTSVAEKLALAKECHVYAQKCVTKAPKNAECHLAKGVCYAMEASTRGPTFKTMRICRLMDSEFAQAMNLSSDFRHKNDVSTKQLAQVFRGILYRVMPENIWFRFLAGIRGNREKSYQWIKEAVKGSLEQEPIMILELGAAALCYGKTKNKPERVTEGLEILRAGVRLPTRYSLDEYDKGNMAILLERPNEACNYRRERFENITEKAKKVEALKEQKAGTDG